MNKSILIAALLSVSFAAQAMQNNEVVGKEKSNSCKPVTILHYNTTSGNTQYKNYVTTTRAFFTSMGIVGYLVLNLPSKL